jgi:D123
MTRNKLFLNQEYRSDKKNVALVLMPWNHTLESKYEFRIFVVNGKLTAVSQQMWYKLYQYSQDELDLIMNALDDLKFMPDVPYDTFVGDVWIDLQNVNEGDHECHLIECNPFGAQCGAGSSLFEWSNDFDQLYGKKNTIDFRYLSILSYI